MTPELVYVEPLVEQVTFRPRLENHIYEEPRILTTKGLHEMWTLYRSLYNEHCGPINKSLPERIRWNIRKTLATWRII